MDRDAFTGTCASHTNAFAAVAAMPVEQVVVSNVQELPVRAVQLLGPARQLARVS
jgi:hypothetical protein